MVVLIGDDLEGVHVGANLASLVANMVVHKSGFLVISRSILQISTKMSVRRLGFLGLYVGNQSDVCCKNCDFFVDGLSRDSPVHISLKFVGDWDIHGLEGW